MLWSAPNTLHGMQASGSDHEINRYVMSQGTWIHRAARPPADASVTSDHPTTPHLAAGLDPCRGQAGDAPVAPR